MEDKKSPPKKKSLSNQVDKVTRRVQCEFQTAVPRSCKKRLIPELSLQKKSSNQEPSQRVLVTINPRSPAVKTIFLAEKSRFRRGSEKSKSLLAIGDHPSISTYFSEARSSSIGPIARNTDKIQGERKQTFDQAFHQVPHGLSQVESPPRTEPDTYKTKKKPTETCYMHADRPIPSINQNEPDRYLNKSPKLAENICNHIHAKYINNSDLSDSISNLNRKLDILKRLIRNQEMVLGDNDHSLSSSDDEPKDMMRSSSRSRPGCSYVEYSHVPETSAFQRYAQQSGPLSTNKGTTIEKEHNSEQYGRDFTTYDGLTARGRRQCASATTKRDDQPQQAAERMIKIRHKLNPVRDYRLMDTVHYLAQGEFAPRNDGIKLTPSREAVLSDIIWEDVCRTHWPTTRLGRRHQERSSTRCELQRLIDSLLRERVAHVERRRRRHYRIVKLNNRQETSQGGVGKTGDIIVASHKHKHPRDENAGHNASGVIMSSQRWPDHGRRSHRSDEQLMAPERGSRRRPARDECAPGPSYGAPRAAVNAGPPAPTCCYHAAGPSKRPYKKTREDARANFSSSSTASSEKQRGRNPRLVVKKDPSRKKYHQKEELNLEHFILLPTLVVRTPSNVKRQKKFNELYHRILNQLSTEQNDETGDDRDQRTDAHSHRNFPKTESVISMDHGKNK